MTNYKKIEIIVFDVGEGDSIAVEFPVGGEMKWGIIDCCQRSDDNEPSVLRFIRDNSIQELEFVCLTHFHYDHYRGLSKVLQYFEEHDYPIHWFWRYGIVSPTEVCIQMYKYAEELRGLTAEEEEARLITRDEKEFAKERVKELRKILEWQNRTAEKMKRQKIPFIRRLHGGTIFHRYDKNMAFYCLAPTGDMVREREEYIARAAAGFGNVLEEETQHANLSSAILLLTFGKANMLFGGDAGKDIWSNSIDLLKKSGIMGNREVKADFVKASHHGSRYSSSKTLWSAILRKNAFIAISADYRDNSYKHPHTKTLDDLRSMSKQMAIRLGCTNAPPICIKLASIVRGRPAHYMTRSMGLIASTVSVLPAHVFSVGPSVESLGCFGDIQISVNPSGTPMVTINRGSDEKGDCCYLSATDDDIEKSKQSVQTRSKG
jgi:beta-lactamase superfamily II metal-dependent hydrolase